MGIDWEAVAQQVGDDEQAGTASGRRALEILLGEENIRNAVDYWISQKPGCFTAEMVLKIIRSKIAMERCYEVYKAEHGTENASRAVFLLASIADAEALPWIREFLDDSSRNIRWNGIYVLRNVLYGPLGDEAITTANELLDKAESDPDPEIRERTKDIRSRAHDTLHPS
jgi:HEAT repeat protein